MAVSTALGGSARVGMDKPERRSTASPDVLTLHPDIWYDSKSQATQILG